VGSSGAVEGVAVPPGVESDQVQCDGAVDVFEVGFCQAVIAGLVQVGDGDCLPDGCAVPILIVGPLTWAFT
jgi:hypothetical protein